MPDNEKLLAYLRRATADLGDARQRLREAEDARHDPVAIVATSAIVLLQNHGIRSLNEFLEENDLYDEYYFPETE